MWLLNATTEDQRKGLADYFNPTIPVSRVSAGGAGMLEGRSLSEEAPTAGSVPTGEPPKTRADIEGPAPGDAKASPDGQAGDASKAGPSTDPATDAAAETEPDSEAQAGDQGNNPEAEPRAVQAATEMADPEAAAAAAAAAAEQAERDRLAAIGRQIAERMRTFEDGALERHFVLRLTPEGLVIEIIDVDDQPLFSSGSAEPAAILPTLIDILVPVLNETTNDIAVVAHTDAIPFGGASYSNWELSADRANAARRLLTGSGLEEARIKQVTGKAAVDPLVPDPNAPQNRRIAITLLADHPR